MITITLRRICTIAILAVSLLAVTGCATDRQVISQAQDFHTELKPAVVQDAKLAGYIQTVGDRIIAAARQYAIDKGVEKDHDWMFSDDMKFHFVNSQSLNAFTTGGNHMYVYTQLFEDTRTEDELAAVMSHEFAHVYCRHVQAGMNRQYGILAAAGVAGAAGYAAGGSEKGGDYAGMAAGAAMLAGQLVGMRYTRGDEAQADQMGFEFYVRAGWDPDHFGDFFQSMIDKGLDKGPVYLSDHPSLASRATAARQWAKDLPASMRKYRKPPVATPQQYAGLQQRAAAIAGSMPTDQQLAKSQQLLAAISRSCITPSVQPDQQAAEKKVLAELEKRKQSRKK